jgi:hypothetical protein
MDKRKEARGHYEMEEYHIKKKKEFNAAIDYYEDIEPGLGFDFALEVHAAIKRSVDFPKAWAVLEGDIRRSLPY